MTARELKALLANVPDDAHVVAIVPDEDAWGASRTVRLVRFRQATAARMRDGRTFVPDNGLWTSIPVLIVE